MRDVLTAMTGVEEKNYRVQLTRPPLLRTTLSCAARWTTWNAAYCTMGEYHSLVENALGEDKVANTLHTIILKHFPNQRTNQTAQTNQILYSMQTQVAEMWICAISTAAYSAQHLGTNT